MPYLHFDSYKGMGEWKKIITDSSQRKGAFNELQIEAMAKDEMLIHAYLRPNLPNEGPKLHLRRTLDQFYYPAINTEARDKDQVVYKCCTKHQIDPKIFMVDQLWLLILGKGFSCHFCARETLTLLQRSRYHKLPSEMETTRQEDLRHPERDYRGHVRAASIDSI
jgi:hypothetical protein